MGSLADFQKQYLYQPKVKGFKDLIDKGIDLVLLEEVGLIEASAIPEIVEENVSRLINPDKSNNYAWPKGAYQDLSPDVIEISSTIYCLQYPEKKYSVDEIIWMFLIDTPTMLKVFTHVKGVVASVSPLIQGEAQVIPISTVESDVSPQLKLDSDTISAGQ